MLTLFSVDKMHLLLSIVCLVVVLRGCDSLLQSKCCKVRSSALWRAVKKDGTEIETIKGKVDLVPKSEPFRYWDSLRTAIRGTQIALLGLAALPSGSGASDVTKESPVIVLGSGGKTGKIIVGLLAKQNIFVQPVRRSASGSGASDAVNEFTLPLKFADVTKPETLNVIKGAAAVVFAASASNKGGNAKQVDYLGVENVAKECIKYQIPKLVVISSGAVTRPDSLGFKITNLFGGIMDYKLKGETSLRNLYLAENNAKTTYTIIRPGGLLDGDAVGPTGIELNQGDTISGEINRADVAECTVAAVLSKDIPPNVTFEVYQIGKSGPLQSDFPKQSGYERNGKELSDYDRMLKGLKSGVIEGYFSSKE